MTLLKLKPIQMTPAVMDLLERRRLVATLKAPRSMFTSTTRKSDLLKTHYQSKPEFGGHKLISVQKNSTHLQLVAHPDKEEFILLNPTSCRFKPLLLAIGLHKRKILEARAKSGKLTEKDILLVELRYNDPRLSYFTMLEETAHFEATLRGKGIGPVFFVTEPSAFVQYDVNLGDYALAVL